MSLPSTPFNKTQGKSLRINRTLAHFVFAVVVIVAVLGMPIIMGSPLHHEMGCPFAPGETAMCATSILGHIAHWQSAFASILCELLALAAFALFALQQWRLALLPEQNFTRVRVRGRAPHRPTLLQELFSAGILNPKPF